MLAFTFQHLTSLFEAFLFDLLKAILVNNPVQLAQERQIRVRDVIAAPDLAALVEGLAERELLELAYKRPRDWFDFLNRLVKIGCPTSTEIDAFTEIKACRDLLTHNSAVANAVYVEKSGANARWKLGDQVVIEKPYYLDCWRLVKKLVNDLSATLKAKLGST